MSYNEFKGLCKAAMKAKFNFLITDRLLEKNEVSFFFIFWILKQPT